MASSRARWARACRSPALLALALILEWGLPIVFGGRSLFLARWVDSYPSLWGPAQSAALVHDLLAAGELPLWNPLNAVGAPLAADLPGIYTPLHWLPFLAPTLTSWEIVFLLRFWILGVGAFALLRSLGVREWIALGTALLYMFNGHHMVFGNAWHMNTVAFVPFLLIGMNDVLEQGRSRRGMALVSASWCLMIFGSGLIDVVLTALLASTLFAAWAIDRVRRDQARSIAAPLAKLAAASVIGLGLSGVFLLPLLELRELAVAPIAGRSSGRFDSVAYGSSLFFHHLTETPADRSNYWMNWPQHMSILLLAGVLLGLLSARGAPRNQRVWFAGAALFAGFHAAKLYALLPADAFDGVPLLEHVKFQKYQGDLQLCMHLMAGLGFDWALLRRSRRGAVPEAAVGLGLALLPWLYLALGRATARPISGSDAIFASAYGLIALGFCLLLARARHRPGRAVVAAGCAVCVLAAWIDLEPDFLGRRGPLHPQGDAYEWLVQRTTSGMPSRVYDASDANPNTLQPLGLHDVRFYSDSLQPRYRALFVGHVAPGTVKNRISVMASSSYARLGHDVLAYLGVGHYLVLPGVAPGPHHATTVMPRVVRDRRAFPRAYLVHDVRFDVPAKEILREVVGAPFSLRHRAFVEAPAPKGFEAAAVPDEAAEVVMIEYASDRVVVDVRTGAAGLLVLLDQDYPGWEATVDGRPTPILPTNYLYRGVPVPAGESRIVFEYRPASFRAGLALSLASLVLLGGVLQRHGRHRRSVPAAERGRLRAVVRRRD